MGRGDRGKAKRWLWGDGGIKEEAESEECEGYRPRPHLSLRTPTFPFQGPSLPLTLAITG